MRVVVDAYSLDCFGGTGSSFNIGAQWAVTELRRLLLSRIIAVSISPCNFAKGSCIAENEVTIGGLSPKTL